MSGDEESHSLYHAPLEIKSQLKIEKRNLGDENTDMYLMSSTDFRKMVTENPSMFTTKQTESSFAPYGNLDDNEGKFQAGVTFTTKERPNIVREEGASPCSLIFAFDSDGNFAVIHNTQYQEFTDEEQLDPQNLTNLENLQNVIKGTMKDDYRVVITGTNIDTQMRTKVEASIREKLPTVSKDRIDTIYTDGDNVRFDTIRPGKVNSARDNIYGVYFFPKALTSDHKNKIVLVGNADQSRTDTDNMVWLSRNFKDLYKAAN